MSPRKTHECFACPSRHNESKWVLSRRKWQISSYIYLAQDIQYLNSCIWNTFCRFSFSKNWSMNMKLSIDTWLWAEVYIWIGISTLSDVTGYSIWSILYDCSHSFLHWFSYALQDLFGHVETCVTSSFRHFVLSWVDHSRSSSFLIMDYNLQMPPWVDRLCAMSVGVAPLECHSRCWSVIVGTVA